MTSQPVVEGDEVLVEFDAGWVPGVVVRVATDRRNRRTLMVQTCHGYVGV